MRGWRERAACARTGADPELFFALGAGPRYEAQVAAAKAVCASCGVRAECLDEALIRIPDGIAGGLTPAERRGRRPLALHLDAVVEVGSRPDARRSEREAAGRVLLAQGRPVREVVRRCGVTTRTVTRWMTTQRAEESRGGHRAPLLISHTRSTQAGTPTQEEGRS